MKKINKYSIKTFFTVTLWKPFRCLFYVFYFMRYPFLQPRNVWTGKKYWDFNEFWCLPRGWKKAFGKQLRNDLRKALIKDGILHDFYFTQIKEKYGTLRLYNNGEGENTSKVIRYYENLSMCYCIMCGKPARYCTQGWIEYVCEDCFNKIERYDEDADPKFSEYKKLCRLKEEDIPKIIRHYPDGKEEEQHSFQ